VKQCRNQSEKQRLFAYQIEYALDDTSCQRQEETWNAGLGSVPERFVSLPEQLCMLTVWSWENIVLVLFRRSSSGNLIS